MTPLPEPFEEEIIEGKAPWPTAPFQVGAIVVGRTDILADRRAEVLSVERSEWSKKWYMSVLWLDGQGPTGGTYHCDDFVPLAQPFGGQPMLGGLVDPLDPILHHILGAAESAKAQPTTEGRFFRNPEPKPIAEAKFDLSNDWMANNEFGKAMNVHVKRLMDEFYSTCERLGINPQTVEIVSEVPVKNEVTETWRLTWKIVPKKPRFMEGDNAST